MKNKKCKIVCGLQDERQKLTEEINRAELALITLSEKKLTKNLKTYFKLKQKLTNLTNQSP